ncbi:MAG: anaerobic ribonucleoside-triphosphate reductase [Clostridia bacterium]
MIKIIKKDGTREDYNVQKVITAVNKSAYRALITFTQQDIDFICKFVDDRVKAMNKEEIQISEMHNIVEFALEAVNPIVAKSYKDYRNYKQDFVHMLDEVYKKSQAIMYIGDKENSNADSALVSTKRSLIFNQLNKELYQKFFLTTEEMQACRDGYIYIHDMSARRDTMNCCLFDVGRVLRGGFEMGNIWYNEPKSLDVAFDVIGDIVLSAASQQYGGFTVPQVDKLLAPYAEKTYKRQFDKYKNLGVSDELADKEATNDVKNDYMQGFQGWEYKFNTVASSRGDYPFITVSAGLACDKFGKMAAIALLEVRKNGQGKKECKKPVLFPKVVFLFDKNLHGEGKELRDVYEAGIECSSKTMYPDWLSLTGDGYVASIYKKYGEPISPMGCRAFLSPYFERGGMEPADENDKPIFVGRFNIGAISLHLPMIYAKAKHESKDFYEVLDYYLELIRQLHLRTYEYLGQMRASTNPLAYCEGGFYGGNLKYNDKIAPLLKPATASFGITALNELQEIHNQKSLVEDGQFAIEVMEHINKKVNEFKVADGRLYALYGTPAENLCGLQIEQFRKKYGIVKNVSDRPYVSNSFHCHVSEEITPIQKQNLENRFWNLMNGGKIQYVKYPIDYNKGAIRTLVDRAMEMGLYEGINLSLSYCDDCGHQELEMDVCPVCGSKNLTKIDRMNGYLSYSRVKGDTRLNAAKMAEIKDRKSM